MFEELSHSIGKEALKAARDLLDALLQRQDLTSEQRTMLHQASRAAEALPVRPTASYEVVLTVRLEPKLEVPGELEMRQYSLTFTPTWFTLESRRVARSPLIYFLFETTIDGGFEVNGDFDQWCADVAGLAQQPDANLLITRTEDSELDDEDEDYPASTMEAMELLPAWFVKRMMTDAWHFGLLTTSGNVIGIHQIHRTYQAADGSIWIDVELMSIYPPGVAENVMFIAPTSRTQASINTSHIVTAFELADT
ncbi:MAG: hypothetical protein KME07_20085 [Pegethrix bostrychoides GSE-TBD4-15B]|jgi:hypothetical protein|uniref:Uncharacterized protein n=1 Tax=Pegethrix bostrychoides GSE-TBD4-15B TaxID=2839662 RepID=A0A951PEU0_9CYAN|nr:hypothetical protein [Pegethrix bostrychoides GSE-TBD4-15B]